MDTLVDTFSGDPHQILINIGYDLYEAIVVRRACFFCSDDRRCIRTILFEADGICLMLDHIARWVFRARALSRRELDYLE